jgi:hypothetical protein
VLSLGVAKVREITSSRPVQAQVRRLGQHLRQRDQQRKQTNLRFTEDVWKKEPLRQKTNTDSRVGVDGTLNRLAFDDTQGYKERKGERMKERLLVERAILR